MTNSRSRQERQQKIIDEVARFEACTMPHLHDACCPDISYNATGKVVNSLVIRDELDKFTLDEATNRKYVRLGRRPNARLERPYNKKPLGPEQLERALAAAAYCRLPGIMRPRLALEELSTRFPNVDAAHFHQDAFYDDVGPDQKERFAAIHLHFSLSPSQRVMQCEKHVERLARVPGFRTLFENDRDEFVLAIVTDRDNPNHIDRLCELFEDTPAHWSYRVRFRIGIIEPLFEPKQRDSSTDNGAAS